MSTVNPHSVPDEIDLSLNEVLEEMSERGRLEWELAATRASLKKAQVLNAELTQRVDGQETIIRKLEGGEADAGLPG